MPLADLLPAVNKRRGWSVEGPSSDRIPLNINPEV